MITATATAAPTAPVSPSETSPESPSKSAISLAAIISIIKWIISTHWAIIILILSSKSGIAPRSIISAIVPGVAARGRTIIHSSFLLIQHLVQLLGLHKERVFLLSATHVLSLFFHSLHHHLFFAISAFLFVFHHLFHATLAFFPLLFLLIALRFAAT